jgi:hypothetical protein
VTPIQTSPFREVAERSANEWGEVMRAGPAFADCTASPLDAGRKPARSPTPGAFTIAAVEEWRQFIRDINSMTDAELRQPRPKPRVRVKAVSRYFPPGFPAPRPATDALREAHRLYRESGGKL